MLVNRNINTTDEEISFLQKLYDEQPLPVDKLPYTQYFDLIVYKFQYEFGLKYGHQQIFLVLIRLRKVKKLRKKGHRLSILKIPLDTEQKVVR